MTENNLKEIRYYTELDPYYYSVDNRPIKDIYDNLIVISKELDNSNSLAFTSTLLFSKYISLVLGGSNKVLSSGVTLPGGLDLVVGQSLGILESAASSSDTTIVSRVAVLNAPKAFTLVAPATAGNSVKYLVQAIFQEIGPGTDSTPLYDNTNPYLVVGTTHGLLRLELKAGQEATTGAEISPTPDSGFTALFSIRVSSGQTQLNSEDLSFTEAFVNPRSPTSGPTKITGNYSITSADQVLVSTLSAASTATLPDSAEPGRTLKLKNHPTSVNNLVVVTAGSTLIENEPQTYLTPGVAMDLLFDGEGWLKV